MSQLPIPATRFMTGITPLIKEDIAMYSASVVESATCVCNLEAQEAGPFAYEMIQQDLELAMLINMQISDQIHNCFSILLEGSAEKWGHCFAV